MKRSTIALVAALAASLGLFASVVLSQATDEPFVLSGGPADKVTASNAVEQKFDLPRDHGPFLTGRRVSLDEARVLGGFALRRPNHPIANDTEIRGVYVEIASGDGVDAPIVQVAIDYTSGILVLLEPASQVGFAEDPGAQYQEMAEGWPAGVQASQVRGVPALVIPRNVAENGVGNPAAVDLTLDGVRVGIYAKYAPLEVETVLAIAETVA